MPVLKYFPPGHGSAREVAKMMGVSETQVRKLAADGRLPGAKQHGKYSTWMFDLEAARRWHEEMFRLQHAEGAESNG